MCMTCVTCMTVRNDNDSYDHYLFTNPVGYDAGRLPANSTEHKYGMLGKIRQAMYHFPQNDSVDISSPNYDIVDGNNDHALNQAILALLRQAADAPLNAFYPIADYRTDECDKMMDPSICIHVQQYNLIKQIRYKLPAAGVSFGEINDDTLNMLVQTDEANSLYMKMLVTQYDSQYSQLAANGPPLGRLMVVLTDVINSYASYFGLNITISSAMVPLPSVSLGGATIDVVAICGAMYFALPFSLFFAEYVVTLVAEKETRSLEFLRMNGMDLLPYYGVTYLHHILYYIAVLLPVVAIGLLVNISYFVKPSLLVWAIFLVSWGLCQTSLSFFFSHFFKHSKGASTASKTFVWLSCLCGLTVSMVLSKEGGLEWYYLAYPHVAFVHGMFQIAFSCTSGMEKPFDMEIFMSGHRQLRSCVTWMLIESIVFVVLGFYLDEVFAGEFGVSKSWLWFLQSNDGKSRWWTRKQRPKSSKEYEPLLRSPVSPTMEEREEDDDVLDMRKRIYSGDICMFMLLTSLPEAPKAFLLTNDLHKEFTRRDGTRFVAVQDVTIEIEQDTLFCLLGPNGAGTCPVTNTLTKQEKQRQLTCCLECCL